MIVYIAGPITGDPEYAFKFIEAMRYLEARGHTVISPAVLPSKLQYEKLMKICFSMIDQAEAVYMLDGWEQSPGAQRERKYAQEKNLYIAYQKIEWAKE